jgi:UDP-N-acetylmuramoylalanine--D-glutamate ligase
MVMNRNRHASVRYWLGGRDVCVVGLGKSGVAAAKLLDRCGARVFITERRARKEVLPFLRQLPRGARCETGSHSFLRRKWDLLVVSPGVPSSVWRGVTSSGTPVWGELELAVRVLKSLNRWPRRVAAVTGTNGKTTCAALMGAIFRAAGEKTVVAGNIGTPLSDCVDRLDSGSVLVLEVSSYQLETAAAFYPAAGAVLNVTPDHLGRHGDMERYAKTKFRLFEGQTGSDLAVLNRHDSWCRRLAGTVPGRVAWYGHGKGRGIYHIQERIVSRIPGAEGSWPVPRLLVGRHNVENAMAAVACARFLGAGTAAVRRALKTFPGVEHRLERVRERRGVMYVNDSKATNVDSTAVALRSFPETRRLHLILGGEDKGAPYAPLRALVKGRVKEILLVGEASRKIAQELKGLAPAVFCGTLEKAVRRAAENAASGDTVLLSPACASFDQFDNFEHRGKIFKELVATL